MNPAHNLITSVTEKITLPDVYHRIRELIERPDARIDDFVDAISFDPALVTRIIRIANNPFFGYSRKVETVKQAISLIGVIQLHDVLLSSLAIRAFSGIPTDIINQKMFWRSSVYCGITSKLLAKKYMLPTGERLFTSGLLHEIGHLVMYAKIPDQIQDVLFESEQSEKPLYLLERESLGFDYGQLGSEIMQFWRLPASYCEMSIYHIEPEKAENNKIEITLVNLARSIMLAGEQDTENAIDSILKESNNLLENGLTKQELEKIISDARSYIDEVMECLWPFVMNISQDPVAH